MIKPPNITLHHKGRGEQNFRFSIVIPSWNNLELLKLSVGSIQKNSTFNHQLIIHVNEGTDGTLQWVQQQPVSYTHSVENAGVCFALNAAASLATTDYIVYMNDDMYACPGWDSALWNEIQDVGHEYFFFSGTMIEPAGNNFASITPHSYGMSAASFNEEALLREFNTYTKNDWSGAGWPPNVVHKKLWNLVGGYSIEFSPGFYSDPDFCMKLWQCGVRIFKGISQSRVYHFQSKSTARVKGNNGRQMFAAKWGFPSSYLYKEILKMGQPYSGPLPEIKVTGTARLKAFWQRVKS
jgi:glycosyltransferase involved in cell wall biosynthesis